MRLIVGADMALAEKWFIMDDSNGNSIRGSVSLNESRQALELNAENVDVNCHWEGGRELQRVNKAKTDFNRLWKDEVVLEKTIESALAIRSLLLAGRIKRVL